MTEHDDDAVGARVRKALEAADDNAQRIQEFQDQVRDMPGPLGALLRQVGHAWSDFETADDMGGATVGEEIRLRGVLSEAMAVLGWLREGERS